jgi:hemerythrin superfamily protein
MDPFVLLKRDHKRLSSFFEELFSAPTSEKKKDIFCELRKELKEHMDLEERYFHPVMEDHKKTLWQLNHAQDEFEEMRYLLRKLQRKRNPDKDWLALAGKLQEVVKHHFRDDRQTFSQVEEYLNYYQQQDIGDRMLRRKEKRHLGFFDRLKQFITFR